MKKNKKKGPNTRMQLAMVCFVGGIVFSIAMYFGTGGNLSLAASQILILWTAGAWAYFGKGDMADTMRQNDERQQQIIRQAGEYTLGILTVVLLCGTVYEMAKGIFGGPFLYLSSLTGFVFLSSIVILRART